MRKIVGVYNMVAKIVGHVVMACVSILAMFAIYFALYDKWAEYKVKKNISSGDLYGDSKNDC